MRKLVLLLAALGACSPAPPIESKTARAVLVRQAAAPEVGVLDDAAIAALRDEGPAALARLLDSYDALAPGAERSRLESAIDRVAAQRYATTSRLFWHTDLERAKAAARSSKKPILALRMLGRLDEELSCANSRLFRTVLYSNAEVSRFLAERFELYWSSERPVPRITIDYGDGRKLVRTVTGNSAHYVLDAEGRPLDVLPGLYAPKLFIQELSAAAELHRDLAGLATAEREALLVTRHGAKVASGARVRNPVASRNGSLALAQRATMTKARIEVPMLTLVDLADPGTPADPSVWESVGVNVFGLQQGQQLDAQSRELVLSIVKAPAEGVEPLTEPQIEAMLKQLDQSLIADSALNEVRLRAQIAEHLVSHPGVDFASLNGWIYENVFHTPADDRWLGLLPRSAYSALPADGVVNDG